MMKKTYLRLQVQSMERLVAAVALSLCCLVMAAKTVTFGNGRLTTTVLAPNAVRIQYVEGTPASDLPDWVYVKHDEVKAKGIKVDVDARR